MSFAGFLGDADDLRTRQRASGRGFAFVALLLLAGCGSTPAATSGTGGATSATGGQTSAGGSGAAGGAAGAIGAAGAAGVAGAASAAGTAGAAGAAGAAGTTGAAGTAGAAGAAGAAGTTGAAGAGGMAGTGGAAGAVHEPPSCAGFQGTECQGGNCCESPLVPGGTVSNNGSDWAVPSFRLDKYEVTVARFRNFVNAAPAWQAAGNPVQGAGAHPSVAGSGWRTDWMLGAWLANGLVPTWYGYPTSWGSTPDSVLMDGVAVYVVPGSDQLAVNWVPFNIAFAFCIWDGGRLPAKVEWILAAHGGVAQTTYPWGNSPGPAQMFAVLPSPTVTTTFQDSTWKYHAIPVGSAPAAAGLYGHQDLGDGLLEYLRDSVPGTGVPSTHGMIELGGDNAAFTGIGRMMAGASWWEVLSQPDDGVGSLGVGDGDVGFRCARDP